MTDTDDRLAVPMCQPGAHYFARPVCSCGQPPDAIIVPLSELDRRQVENERLQKQLAIAEGVEDNLVTDNERLRAFAENVRDNWGALTGYELERDARAALGERPS